MRAPSTPRMTVTTVLMLCLPGRTRRASMPMTAPKMMVPMISTTMTASFCATVVALIAGRLPGFGEYSTTSRGKAHFEVAGQRPAASGTGRSEGAEAHPASLALAEEDVPDDG